MSSEFERIARVRTALDRESDDVVVGNGDDAAVFSLRTPTVVSVDCCVENTHFRSAWLSLRELGWRSQVAALSDLTAMGARSRFSIVALGVPRTFSDASLDELSAGIGDALDQAGASLIGGNVSAADHLNITTTAIGELVAAPITRAGARPGDYLYVTGKLGGSGAGLAALLRGDKDASETSAWRTPPLRTQLAEPIARHANACIDISDGLGQDLGHLASASGVGFDVDAAQLPLADTLSSNEEGYLGAWVSGEEYELLFTSTKPLTNDACGALGAQCIGRANEQPGCRLHLGRRTLATEHNTGFDHFR